MGNYFFVTKFFSWGRTFHFITIFIVLDRASDPIHGGYTFFSQTIKNIFTAISFIMVSKWTNSKKSSASWTINITYSFDCCGHDLLCGDQFFLFFQITTLSFLSQIYIKVASTQFNSGRCSRLPRLFYELW